MTLEIEKLERITKARAVVADLKTHLESPKDENDWWVKLAVLLRDVDKYLDVKGAIRLAKVEELIRAVKDGDVEINIIVVGSDGEAKVTKKETMQ